MSSSTFSFPVLAVPSRRSDTATCRPTPTLSVRPCSTTSSPCLSKGSARRPVSGSTRWWWRAAACLPATRFVSVDQAKNEPREGRSGGGGVEAAEQVGEPDHGHADGGVADAVGQDHGVGVEEGPAG